MTDKENMMAGVDVSKQLEAMESKLQIHDQMHRDNSETLTEVKNVLVGQAKLTEQFLHLDRRIESNEERAEKRNDKLDGVIEKLFDKIDAQHVLNAAKFDKQDTKITGNHDKLMKWSGIAMGVAITVSAATTAIRFIPVLTG